MTFAELFGLCIDIMGWFTLIMLTVLMVGALVKFVMMARLADGIVKEFGNHAS